MVCLNCVCHKEWKSYRVHPICKYKYNYQKNTEQGTNFRDEHRYNLEGGSKKSLYMCLYGYAQEQGTSINNVAERKNLPHTEIRPAMSVAHKNYY